MKEALSSERGASLVMLSAALVLLLGVAAVAIDLAGLRLDMRADRLASDAAVTAGVSAINAFDGSGITEACETAFDYLELNLEDVSTPIDSTGCETSFPPTWSCTPTSAVEVIVDLSPYRFVVTHPVPDGHDLMGSQAINEEVDGEPCQRMGVTVERTRDHTFARVLGFNTGSTTVHSVARKTPDAGDSEVVPLLVLEPIGCSALFTSGQGKVTVSYDLDTQTPGFIVVDSNASNCSPSNPYSIDSKGNQNGWIRAIPVPDSTPCPPTPGIVVPSAILSYALADIGDADPSASYDMADRWSSVDAADITDECEPADSRYRLYPTPRAISQRITRAPIDWRYNCRDGYAPYLLDTSDPGAGSIEVRDCPDDGTVTPYIDTLEGAYETGLPDGFTSWTGAGHPCTVDTDLTGLTGDWYIDCPGDLIVNGATLTFDGSNIVSDHGFDLRSSAAMRVNDDDGGNYFVFVRDGTLLKRAQASLVLEQTFVYLGNGKVDLRAGDGGLEWIAPVGTTTAPVTSTIYDFEDLALWSEANLPHEIGGQAGNSLTGTFFTPYAEPFVLTGQGGQFQLEAQFITRKLEVKGQGEVKMHPDPTKTTPIPISAVLLIR